MLTSDDYSLSGTSENVAENLYTSRTLPSICAYYLPSALIRYHASQLAIEMFGHDQIIDCIEVARGDETGRRRDYNADAFALPSVRQRLIVIRSMNAPVILALAESEVWFAEEWLHRRDQNEVLE